MNSGARVYAVGQPGCHRTRGILGLLWDGRARCVGRDNIEREGRRICSVAGGHVGPAAAWRRWLTDLHPEIDQHALERGVNAPQEERARLEELKVRLLKYQQIPIAHPSRGRGLGCDGEHHGEARRIVLRDGLPITLCNAPQELEHHVHVLEDHLTARRRKGGRFQLGFAPEGLSVHVRELPLELRVSCQQSKHARLKTPKFAKKRRRSEEG